METKKIQEGKKKEKEKSLNVSNHTRVTSYTNKNMQETHKTKRNTYLRKAAAIDRDGGGSGFVSLNVPPRSSKFRFEAFSKPVFRSFPNFASDLFFYLSFLWIFFCVCKFQIHTKQDKKTHSDIIALCMDQIGERIAATRSQAGVVPFALHV